MKMSTASGIRRISPRFAPMPSKALLMESVWPETLTENSPPHFRLTRVALAEAYDWRFWEAFDSHWGSLSTPGSYSSYRWGRRRRKCNWTCFSRSRASSSISRPHRPVSLGAERPVHASPQPRNGHESAEQLLTFLRRRFGTACSTWLHPRTWEWCSGGVCGCRRDMPGRQQHAERI